MQRKNSKTIIAAVLDAIQRDGQDKERQLLTSIEPQSLEDGSVDSLWLLGEIEYRRAHYREATEYFKKFDALADETTPVIQRYFSLHRQSFAHFALREPDDCQATLDKAQTLIDTNPELEVLRSDVYTIRGYLLEQEANKQGGYAWVKQAFEHAEKHDNWHRAASTAADLARMSANLDKADEAFEWLRKAAQYNEKQPSVRLEQTIRLREGMIFLALKDYQAALKTFSQLVESSLKDETPGTFITALRRQAETLRSMKRLDEAEWVYRRAIADAKRLASPDLMLCYKDFASMLVERGGTGDDVSAQDAFAEAISIVLGWQGQHPLELNQLAQDILNMPVLAGKKWKAALQRSLKAAIAAIDAHSRTTIVQRMTQEKALHAAVAKLEAILRSFIAGHGEIRLAHHTVKTQYGSVEPPGKIDSIFPQDIELLKFILKHSPNGTTIKAMCNAFGVERASIDTALTRIRKAIGDDLADDGKSRSKKYWLQLP